MISLASLHRLRPQRTFLVAGTEDDYRQLFEEVQRTTANLYALATPRFTTDDAQEVARFIREGNGHERYGVIYFSVFSPEAAEALLKVLEEPDSLTTVVWVTPYPYAVPLTVRSRVVLLWGVHDPKVSSPEPMAEILAAMKKALTQEQEDAATRRARALALLDKCEVACMQDVEKAKWVYAAKRMLLRANLPVKFVMEFVMTELGFSL
ncbi:MAG TPA: hypothetical protein VG621_01520 [Candidatus Paceibacterota bacterium]|nr:hypothetical protein [Candidatus Paceibacterota bacterium]